MKKTTCIFAALNIVLAIVIALAARQAVISIGMGALQIIIILLMIYDDHLTDNPR